MKRIGLSVLLVLGACVDSGCPKGSEEVGGTCMLVGNVGGEDGGARGDGGADANESVEESEADAGGRDGAIVGDADGGNDADDVPLSGCAAITCAENAHCEESDAGDASCVCDEGYEGDGVECEVNPCAEGVNPCDAETTACKVEAGAPVCECLEGFARCDEDAMACATDLSSDAANCGECGMACAGNLECADGACTQLVKKLALGYRHSCALTSDDDVLCWGDDEAEQLQRADSRAPLYEAALTTAAKAESLSAGLNTTCILTHDHEAVCWGNDNVTWVADELSQGFYMLGSDLQSADEIVVGSLSACLVADDDARCWGMPIAYEGEPGTAVSFGDRRRFPFAGQIAQMSVGYEGCAVTVDKGVVCWSVANRALYTVEAGTGPVHDAVAVSVSPARSAACSVLESGEVMCWGSNRLGMIGYVGVPIGGVSELAVRVSDEGGNPLRDFVQVAVGSEHACARTEDGSVWCWGNSGLLGQGTTGSSAQGFATQVLDIDDAVEIAVGYAHSCARGRTGQVQCWGDNSHGQLGVAPVTASGIATSPVPVNVIGLP